MINVFQPTLGKEELERIGQVFESNWIGKGKLVAEFEEKYAAHLGTERNKVLSTNCCWGDGGRIIWWVCYLLYQCKSVSLFLNGTI